MSTHAKGSSATVTGAAIVLLGLMAVLAWGAVRRQSAAVDEIAHVGAGVSYLQQLDMRLNEEHPPLAKVVAALPFALRGAHADYSHTSWIFSSGLFKQFLGEWVFGHWFLTRWNDPYSTLAWARMPMLLVTLALGFIIYVYGSRLGGPLGGLLCLCIYATTPTFLTFGPLVLTDIPIALCSVVTLWTFADMWQDPTRRATANFGLALGAALLTKFSAGLLFFCFVTFVISLRLRPLPGQPVDKSELRAWRRLRWWRLIQGIVAAAVVVYLVYLVLSWNEPTESLALIHVPNSPLIRRLLMPPWIYARGLVMFMLTATRPTYLLGKTYPHGVWFYFPVVFALKSALGFLLLLIVMPVVALVSKFRAIGPCIPEEKRLHWRALWTFLIVFAAACMVSRMTISIRHFSVPLALLILLLAPLPRILSLLHQSGSRLGWAGAVVTVALAASCIAVAVRSYPYYMPFMNSLSMGRPAYMLVHDSNVDWNQSLIEVDDWAHQRGLPRVLIDEYGFSDPSVYVRNAVLWNCQQPSDSDAGQWAVVSANMIAESHNCPWLLEYPHQVLAGGSMYAVQLPMAIPAAGTKGGPPLPEDWHNFAGLPGRQDFRLIFLNCIRDPAQLQPTLDRMTADYQAATRNK